MKLKISAFFGVITFVLLLAYEVPIGLALFILVPATFIVAMISFFVFEEVLQPLYKWLTK